MTLDESKQLANLVRLGFSLDFLEVQQLGDIGVNEDVMTPADARKTESKGLGKRHGFGKSYVLRAR